MIVTVRELEFACTVPLLSHGPLRPAMFQTAGPVQRRDLRQAPVEKSSEAEPISRYADRRDWSDLKTGRMVT